MDEFLLILMGRMFGSHTTITYYSESGEFDEEAFDEVWQKFHETFKAMDKFIERQHTPRSAPKSQKGENT